MLNSLSLSLLSPHPPQYYMVTSPYFICREFYRAYNPKQAAWSNFLS